MRSLKNCKRTQRSITAMNNFIEKQKIKDHESKKIYYFRVILKCLFSDSNTLFTTNCSKEFLHGTAVYFMRATLRKSLGEEAFQVKIKIFFESWFTILLERGSDWSIEHPEYWSTRVASWALNIKSLSSLPQL